MATYAPLLEPWLVEGGYPYVVRDGAGELAGVGLAFNTATAPEAAWADPFVGPRLRHARDRFPGEAVVWHGATTAFEDDTGAVQGLLGIGGYSSTATPNPVASYIVITPSRPAAVAFAEAVRAVRIPELDATAADGTPIQVHVIDHGRGGLVQSIHTTVYAELGLPPSPVIPRPRLQDPTESDQPASPRDRQRAGSAAGGARRPLARDVRPGGPAGSQRERNGHSGQGAASPAPGRDRRRVAGADER